MTIPSTLPSSKRRPGAYSEFNFAAAAAGLVAIPNRVVIIAEKLAAGTAAVEQPIQLFSEADGDTKCGLGSYAAVMNRRAIAQGSKSGAMPEIYVCPVAEPAGGTKATETITVTVTTALSGTIVLEIGDFFISIGVNAGDAQNTIATNIKAVLDQYLAKIPVTWGVAANVVTGTFTTKGANGSDLAYRTVSAPGGVTVACAAGVAGAGAPSLANALAALYDKRYHGVAFSCHTTTEVAAALADAATSWGFTAKNFKFYGFGEAGSLGTAQTLQAAANDERILFFSAEGCPALPGEMAIAGMVAWFSRDKPNANMDGEELVIGQPLPSLAYLDSEVESALNGGVTPLTPATSGAYMKIELLTTSRTTLNSAPFEPLRDAAYARTASYRAEQINFMWLARFKQANETKDFLERVRRAAIGVDRVLERLDILKDVDDLIDKFDAQYAEAPAGRVALSGPFRPAGPVHQLDTINTMFL